MQTDYLNQSSGAETLHLQMTGFNSNTWGHVNGSFPRLHILPCTPYIVQEILGFQVP